MINKKVGIITFHFVNNFGGVLQAYALQRVVREQCGVDTELIDYRNWFIRLTDRVRLLPISTNKSEIISGLRTMRQRIGRRRKFGNFTKENSKLSRKYWNYLQIRKYPPKDDKYICGSDQIWNPFLTMGVSKSYFLKFESNPKNKIAYAPSFGTNGIPRCYERKLKEYIKQIGYISVREKSGQEYIKRLTGREAECLIDPTFLLEKEEWEKIGKNPLEKREPYILLYIMQRDMEVYEYARKVKESTGLRLVEISRYGYQPGFIDEILIDVGPEEFLGLIRDSAYICTNSYHGLVYSLIFQKKFCLIPSKRFKARIDNLLELLQIQLSVCEEGIQALTAEYDEAVGEDIIKKERARAIKFLIASVENKDDFCSR